MLRKIVVLALAGGMVAGCSNMTRKEQRVLSGGAIGAAGGAAVSAVTGGNALLGGMIGAAGGAAVGALTNSTIRK